MNIGQYTFTEFKDMATRFHGYPAPGLLLGGYMVAMAKAAIPAGVLFEVVVESKKCLPDAVQLLTLCSAGNNWMKVVNLGRYALSLFDKYTGEGVRVHVDVLKLDAWPEIRAWYLKRKPKAEQDTEELFRELEAAGDTICTCLPIRIRSRLLGHSHMGPVGVCPGCGEAFPTDDGVLCRGCQGEAPYTYIGSQERAADAALSRFRVAPAEEAGGETVLHGMPHGVPGKATRTKSTAGQSMAAGDACPLRQTGRFSLAPNGDIGPGDVIPDNEGAEAFAKRMAGSNIVYDLPPAEGKTGFRSSLKGLFSVDVPRLKAFNMLGDVMCATRQDATVVEAGTQLAATRVIPLYLNKSRFAEALSVLERPLFSVLPFRPARAGVLVTGTEAVNSLIEDRFIPLISAKVEGYGCQMVATVIVPDDKTRISAAVDAIRAAGADLLIAAGGLSADPGDLTWAALIEAGLTDALYGAPVLPGSMSLVGRLPAPGAGAGARAVRSLPECDKVEQPAPGEMQVVGVPASALYCKTTLFDALLPRLLAGRRITRPELAAMGEGGFCMHCKVCTWPKCFFMK